MRRPLKYNADGSGVKLQELKDASFLAKLLGLFSKGKKRELREQREATSHKLATIKW